MKTIKKLASALMMIAVVAMVFSLSSCSKDDKDEGGGVSKGLNGYYVKNSSQSYDGVAYKDCIKIQGNQMYFGTLCDKIPTGEEYLDSSNFTKVSWYNGWYGITEDGRSDMWYSSTDFVQVDDALYTTGGDIWSVSGTTITCSYFGSYTKVK